MDIMSVLWQFGIFASVVIFGIKIGLASGLADAAGKPTMQIFDLVERKNETPSKNDFKADLSDFVKREEITHLEERIAKLEGLNAKQKAKGDNVDG